MGVRVELELGQVRLTGARRNIESACDPSAFDQRRHRTSNRQFRLAAPG